MIRSQISKLSKRLYSDSKFNEKLPVARYANKKLAQVSRSRRDSQAAPRVEPSPRSFEPFPFAVTEDNKHVVLRRVIEPLIDVPYEEQLASKETFCRNALRHLAQELYNHATPVRLDVRRLPCHVNPIVKPPQLFDYRNKDEFSIWRGLDGKTPVVGYLVFPISKHGDSVCVEPTECRTLKRETRELCSIAQDFIVNQAKQPVCYSLGVEGGWRRFIVRVNNKGELMLIGILNPVNLRVKDVVEERDNFKEFMVNKCKEAGLQLKSLYYQPCPYNRCPHKNVPFELLYGDKTLYDEAGSYKFVVSPETFVHNSTCGMQSLNDSLRETVTQAFELDKMPDKPMIINVNCGAGLSSISLADLAERVIGVDSSSQAIEDARQNVELNKVENCDFICSDIEIVIEKILDNHAKANRETIVVCSVPKIGLHRYAIEALRECSRVKKIVYMTPKVDAKGTLDNMIGLCSKGKARSQPPFAPVLATPVDVYPHIESCQLVLALERVDLQ